MDLNEKKLVMFELFLSMQGIYVDNKFSEKIKMAFMNALSNNIDYEMNNEYFESIKKTLVDLRKIQKK